MAFQKEYLDLVLVPSGLFIMFAYHLYLLYMYLLRPHATVMGFENFDKRVWVDRIMQVEKKDVGSALTVLTSNTSAAIYLATISLTLCSLIGAWMVNSSNFFFQSEIIYGDTTSSTLSIKYISLLACFLLAFSLFVQSIRNFIHANYLITTPASDIPLYVKYVEMAVIRGGEFWSLGLRALYFALNLLLWFFGPIPMFVSSIVMVATLSYLDRNTIQRSSVSLMVKRDIERANVGGDDH